MYIIIFNTLILQLIALKFNYASCVLWPIQIHTLEMKKELIQQH